jgi:chorismate-pyruvate lyase
VQQATSGLALDALGVVPRILLATDGTLTHILEAYAAEPVYLVKLSHDLVTDQALRGSLGLDEHERALRRVILLRGTKSEATFVCADSVVMLDRLPGEVARGLLETDTPIGKLLFSCRAETFREIIAAGLEHDRTVAAHFGIAEDQPLVSRTYQIVYEGRPVAVITEKFPNTALVDLGP